MLHKTALERYEKLKRVFGRLMDHFDRDDLDDFILTANSLREWIRRDNSLIQEQKDALERFVVDRSVDWQICNQIANNQKHVNGRPRMKARQTSEPIPVVTAVQVSPGGTGFRVPPSMRVVGAGDDIVIEYNGNSESALAFVVRTFRHFHYIFEVAPIPIERRKLQGLTELLGG
jgi:hypothetical protein